MNMRSEGHTDPEYRTYLPKQEHIPHYYGDVARQFMIGGAALMLVTLPFTGADSVMLSISATNAVVALALSALTNPHGRLIMGFNVFLTGASVILFEIFAVVGYANSSLTFVLREAIAVVFMFAFYYSLKSFRAMILNQIGQPAAAHEFDPAPPETSRRQYGRAAAVDDLSLDALGHPAAPEDDTAGD